MSAAWPSVPLGEVMRHRKHFTTIDDLTQYKRCRVQLHAQGIIQRDQVPGSEINTKTQQVCRAGEFLVAEIDAKMGGFGIVPPELDGAIVSSHYFLFEVIGDLLDRRYLGWYCKTPAFRDQVRAQGTTNYAAIRPAHVLGYAIPLPPLAEQRRIVGRLDALAAKVEEAKKLQAVLECEREVLATSARTPALNPEALGKWPSMFLGEISEIQSGVTLGRNLSGHTVELPYLRVANVQEGHLDLTTIKTVAVRPEEADKWKLLPGDILLTEGGDWDKLGRGTVWRGEIDGCIHQNHIFRVRVDPTRFVPEFLSCLLGSAYGKRYFQAASKQTTNLASINQRQLKAFVVFQPPLSEQSRIVGVLKRLDSQLAGVRIAHSESAARVDALLPSLLDRAFSGAL